jgi:spoIIIJ-associated protein
MDREQAPGPLAEPTEFEERTVERAIEEACRHFEVSSEDLEIEILTRGSTGIFGLGGRKAKIRVTLRPGESRDRGVVQVPSPPPETEEVPAMAAATEEASEKPGAPADFPTPAETTQLHRAREVAEVLIRGAGLKVEVSEKSNEEGNYLDLAGEDISLAIGKEGQTLDALEYLVNRIISREGGTSFIARLDAQGYRAKKEESISRMAHRVADRVRKTGRPMALHPMNPRDRRIVHLCLKENRGVRTRSVGEGRLRKVVVSPQRSQGRSQRRQSKP